MSQVQDKQLASGLLRSIAAVGSVAANKMLYSTGTDTFAVSDVGPTGLALLACANSAAANTALGLGSLALQAANAVAISGGTLAGITSLSMGNLSAGTGGTINFSDNAFIVRPTANSTATYAGFLVKMTYDGSADLTGGGHTIGLWGYSDINAAGRTVNMALSVEGKMLVRAGTLTSGACFHGGLEDVYSGATLTAWTAFNVNITDNHGTVVTAVGHDMTVTAATNAIQNLFAFRAKDVLLAQATSYAAFYGLVSSKAGAHYNILCSGTAKNAIAGFTRFGGVTDPTEVVDVTGNVKASGVVQAGLHFRVNGVQVVAARKTGWTLATGTALRTGFDTATATLTQVAQSLKALIDDLHGTAGHGLIGT